MYAYFIYVYVTELCQQLYIYNEEVQCRSHTSCAQVLQLPQSEFGDNREGALFSMVTYVLCPIYIYMYIIYIYIYIYI